MKGRGGGGGGGDVDLKTTKYTLTTFPDKCDVELS